MQNLKLQQFIAKYKFKTAPTHTNPEIVHTNCMIHTDETRFMRRSEFVVVQTRFTSSDLSIDDAFKCY